MLHLFVLDFKQSIVWKEIFEFDEPELKQLAEALPQTVLQGRALSTTRKYAGAYRRWKEWANRTRSDRGFPVNVALFGLYLQHLGNTVKSRSAVSDAVNAVSTAGRGGASSTRSPHKSDQ